ncbi:MAG UNVERIFIED_CONTAM: hypothetical protein LVQ98_06950 [Rickettsiaceae bacterium]|jgi:uncharacterized protein (DUF3820 family)
MIIPYHAYDFDKFGNTPLSLVAMLQETLLFDIQKECVNYLLWYLHHGVTAFPQENMGQLMTGLVIQASEDSRKWELIEAIERAYPGAMNCCDQRGVSVNNQATMLGVEKSLETENFFSQNDYN